MPDFLPVCRNRDERGMGLVEVLVAMSIILIASMAIFGGVLYFSQTNTVSAINLNSVQAAMNAWTSTSVAAASPTANTISYDIPIQVHYAAATSGTQSESIPAALAESGNNYGWTKVATQ